MILPFSHIYVNCLQFQFMTGLLEGSKKSLEMAYQMFGLTQLLLTPPIDAALNIVDVGLHLVYYQVWR